MKTILLLIAFFSIHNAMAQGDLSGSLKGQQQTQKALFGTLEVKNKQSTKTGAVSALIEERSLLENGSFEHQTYQTGWTVTGSATISRETTIVRDGKASFKAVTTGNSFRLEQNTTQLQGTNVPGYAIVWVHNTAPGVQVCSMLAGSDKDCVTALTDGAWQPYIVPMILGATSNGISVHSGTTAGTTYVDWVRLVDEDLIGTSPVITPWKSYTPTFLGFGTPTSIDCKCRQNGGNQEIMCRFVAGTVSGADQGRVSLCDGATSSDTSVIGTLFKVGDGVINDLAASDRTVFIGPSRTYVTFGITSVAGANPLVERVGSEIVSTSGTLVFEASVPVAQYQSSVPTYSDRCRDPLACEYVLTAKIDKTSGTPVVSQENVDWIDSCSSLGTGQTRCTVKTGVSTLPLNCTGSENILSGQTIHSFGMTSNTQFDLYTLGRQDAATYSNVVSGITCVKQGVDYSNAKVNQIVGSFKDYVKTPNTATGKVGFCSAKISATGAISDQLGGCFASCTNATTPVCTFTSNYWRSGSVPNCWGISTDPSGEISGRAIITSSAFSQNIINGSLGANSGSREYFCHGEIQ